MTEQQAAVSKRHRQHLDWIRSFQAEHGHTPTLRQIAKGLGTVVSTAHRNIGEMIEAGLIKRPARRSGQLVILEGQENQDYHRGYREGFQAGLHSAQPTRKAG